MVKDFQNELSDVDSLDIGRFESVAGIDDDTKFNLINNHWKPATPRCQLFFFWNFMPKILCKLAMLFQVV
jgi:hypothetical protein